MTTARVRLVDAMRQVVEYLEAHGYARKYDPDQPRDETGKWTSGGGGGEGGGGQYSNPKISKIYDENIGAYNGQSDNRISVYDQSGELAATLDYSVFEGAPMINMVEAQIPGMNAGQAAVEYLADQYGYINIDWGMMTDAGSHLRDKLDDKYSVERISESIDRESLFSNLGGKLISNDGDEFYVEFQDIGSAYRYMSEIERLGAEDVDIQEDEDINTAWVNATIPDSTYIVRYVANKARKSLPALHRLAAWKAFDRTARKWEPKFKGGAAKALEHDRREILAILTSGKQKALQNKASIAWTDILNDVTAYLEGDGSDNWRSIFRPLIAALIVDQGELWAAKLGITFDVQNLLAREFLNSYLMTFAQAVNQTTIDNIAQIIAKAQAEGSSVPQIQKQLDALFDRYITGHTPDDPDWQWFMDRTPAYRTELIARDQVLRSSNYGNHALFKDWGVVEREWLSTKDDRTRPDHVEMDGKTAPIDEPWTFPDGSQAMFPGDDSLGADLSEIIECRCTELPIIPERQ